MMTGIGVLLCVILSATRSRGIVASMGDVLSTCESKRDPISNTVYTPLHLAHYGCIWLTCWLNPPLITTYSFSIFIPQ